MNLSEEQKDKIHQWFIDKFYVWGNEETNVMLIEEAQKLATEFLMFIEGIV